MSATVLMLLCHEQPAFNVCVIVIDSVRSRVTAHLISLYLFIYLFVRVRIPHSHIHGASQQEIHHGGHQSQQSDLTS